MPNDNNAAGGTENSTEQESVQVSSEKQPDQSDKTNVSEDAKTQQVKTDSSDEDGATEKKESSDKPAPFHKHPRFQRLISRNKRLENTTVEQTEKIGELQNLVKELLALQKGEDFKPEDSKKKSGIPDPDQLLDLEMENLLEEEDLSEEEELAVIELSKKYAKDLGDGKKVYLSPDLALKILRDSQSQTDNKEETETKKTVNTKPSARVSEDDAANTNKNRPPARSIAEAVAIAKRLGALD